MALTSQEDDMDYLVLELDLALVEYAYRRPHLHPIARNYFHPEGHLYQEYRNRLPIIIQRYLDSSSRHLFINCLSQNSEHGNDLQHILGRVWHGDRDCILGQNLRAHVLAQEIHSLLEQRYRATGEFGHHAEAVLGYWEVFDGYATMLINAEWDENIYTLEYMREDQRESHLDNISNLLYSYDFHKQLLLHMRPGFEDVSQLRYEGVSNERTLTAQNEDEECPICREYKATDLGFTECVHVFCLPCLQRCIILARNSLQGRPRCPLCRQGTARFLFD